MNFIKHLIEKKIFFSHNEKIYPLVEKLNQDRIVLVKGMHNSGKTCFTAEVVKKIGQEKNTLYFDTALDLNHSIQSSQELKKLTIQELEKNKNLRIIVLKNFNKIKDIKEYLNYIHGHENKFKIILISNTIQIPGIYETHISGEKIGGLHKYYDLQQHVKYGTLAEIVLLGNNYFIQRYLHLVTNDIFTKDIYNNFSVKNINLYQDIITFLSKNNDFLSLRDLHKSVSHFSDISLKTLIDYLDFSIQAKILYPVYRYDFKKEKIIQAKAKYYFTDNGVRNNLSQYSISKLLLAKNFILAQCVTNGYSISSGVNGTFQFDFYISTNEEKISIYFSGAQGKTELKKEINKLNKVPCNGKKYIICNKISEFSIKKLQYDSVEILNYSQCVEKIFK